MEENPIEEWFHNYERDVTSFLMYYSESIEVEDLVQDTFLTALKKWKTFKGESPPKTWLISIARNIANDRYRRQKIWKNILHYLSNEQQIVPDVENSIVKDFEKRQLYQAIQQLPSKYKEVIILRGILELSPEETAKVLQVKQNHVYVLYHRSLKKLKDILEKEELSNE
ncbi:RNA polymerase sigma-70 factor (ECF subfamily) [Melghiribacillus thermohalophilus]|uniref:RNA polymerase sigma factor n=1 Tax=Melghiribacillus thermohalophilus TaxID=1324956 RepID=A0A4R3MM18_9BACI|nr:RNA polymerase sigma factor [Melghiribacillus thermohalophilus]TCT15979.1 RNA polymerase sigma-70 factor (ECF subfamily) [Melghiribacillus thermohalophilus]